MIRKNHTIVLEDTSSSEMVRFRQIMLNIWRQQIEDDKNAIEMESFIKEQQEKTTEPKEKYTTTWLGEVVLNSDLHDFDYRNNLKKNIFDTFTGDFVDTTEDKFIDRIVYVNGHFYNEDGTFEGKVNEVENEGSVEDVYTCTGKSTQKNKNGMDFLTYNNIESLKIKNEIFLRIAGLAYSESGFSIDVIKRIPFIIVNHHRQLINSKVKKYKDDWFLNNTLIKMRNKWDDQTYAHTFHYGAQGNPAFRQFLNIELNEAIDFNKNETGRNENSKMKTAIEYTIKAIQYLNDGYVGTDFSDGGIGWQGADINSNENWKKWLYINRDHKKNAFKNWSNSSTLEESTFESVSVFKGDFGTTIIYKSTEYSFKNSTTGNL
ncbi:hypothetical protein [Flavobacterium anhuiense]|uniref:hypothetical protein n=1 Tax=Flavobacterium anhuiense TaxID=459526 RepID=UPI000E6BA542|nr:hypothetical protein [Flavobacterium anhuiense]